MVGQGGLELLQGRSVMPADKNRPPASSDRASVAALIFVIVLVAVCVWVFSELKSRNDELNCVVSGRTNCAPPSQ